MFIRETVIQLFLDAGDVGPVWRLGLKERKVSHKKARQRAGFAAK